MNSTVQESHISEVDQAEEGGKRTGRQEYERKERFIKALHQKEDCLVVLGLLREDWSLFNECEPERLLHLGVRRGCAELVEQVLRHLGVDIILDDKLSELAIKEESNSPSSNQGSTTVVAARTHARPVVDHKTLLLSKHDGLDLLARAVLNGNREVLSLLLNTRRNVDHIGPYKKQLRTIAQRVVASITSDSLSFENWESIVNAWRDNPEFNFLFWDFDLWEESVSEYLFHFLFTKGFDGNFWYEAKVIRESLWVELWDSSGTGDNALLKSLLSLHDAQGRTPLHVAVDEGTVSDFNHLLKDWGDLYRFAMMAPDGLGRTAWHRAVVLGNMDAISAMEKYGKEQFTTKMLWQVPMYSPLQSFLRATGEAAGIVVGGISLQELSMRNGFKGYREISSLTPLHSAILHQRTEILDQFATFSPCDRGFDFVIENRMSTLDTLEFATLMGEASTVRRLLDDMSKGKVEHGRYGWLRRQRVNNDHARAPPTIHLAASSGNYEVLKAFIDHPDLCDPYIEDHEKRTVIHHAMKVQDLAIQAHLLDYASLKHFASHHSQLRDDKVERQRCINLLQQSGCDIFKADNSGQAPYPKGALATDKELLSWWYDKQSKEFNVTQSAMSSAANAISVMATLVATASYVGPLQPPLGYSNGEGPAQIQANYVSVRSFIVCDTLSFYLAIASVTFSLIPSLPMPQQAMTDELARTRGMIILAVATLFPSIICILIAFASSSIVVISDNGISSPEGNLTIITAFIGGLICSIGFLLLLTRLLGVTFPRARWIRIIYDWTSSFLQWRSRS